MKFYIGKIIFIVVLVFFLTQIQACIGFRRYHVDTREILNNEKNDGSWAKTEEKELKERSKEPEKNIDVKTQDL